MLTSAFLLVNGIVFIRSNGLMIKYLITRLIEIDIAHLTVLSCNCPLADLQLSALKRYQFQYKDFVGLLWLTSNHMFVSGDFGDKSTLWFLKNLKLPSLYLVNFKIFKKALGQFIPNHPPKHVITSTSSMFDELKEVKDFKEITDFKSLCKIL